MSASFSTATATTSLLVLLLSLITTEGPEGMMQNIHRYRLSGQVTGLLPDTWPTELSPWGACMPWTSCVGRELAQGRGQDGGAVAVPRGRHPICVQNRSSPLPHTRHSIPAVPQANRVVSCQFKAKVVDRMHHVGG